MDRLAETRQRGRVGTISRQLLLHQYGLLRQSCDAAKSAGRAKSVQAPRERGEIVAEAVQLALQNDQFVAQQPAQSTHGGSVAAAVERGIVIQHARRMIALNQDQHSPKVGQRAGLEQHVAETGRKQVAAVGVRQFGTGGHRYTLCRAGLCVAAQLGQDVHGAALRHEAIQQQQIEPLGATPRQRGCAMGKGIYFSAKRAQAIAQEATTSGVIVGNQDTWADRSGRRRTGGFRALAQDEILVVHLGLAEWPDMRATSSHSSTRRLLCWGLLLGFIWCVPAHADVVLSARSISLPGLRLNTVRLRLGEDGAGAITVQLQAERADEPLMGWRNLPIDLAGSLRRNNQMSWILDGHLKLVRAPGGALSNAQVQVQLSPATNTLLIDVVQGKGTVNGWLPLDQPSHAQIRLDNVPLGWLQGLLGTVWSGRTTSGRLNAELALDLSDPGLRSSGQFSLDGVGFDTPSGTLAGQDVGGSGRFTLDSSDGPVRINVDASLRGGELLLGPIYAKLPDHVVQLDLHARAHGGAVELNQLRINDADALQLEGALAFDAGGALKTLRLDRLHASFPVAYTRYGKAWFDTLGLHGLKIAGDLNASLDLRGAAPRSFSFSTDGLDLADAGGRLAIDGLRGGLDWAAKGDRPATSLAWRSLRFHRIENGAAQASWRSHDGVLSLQGPLDMPVLGGQLRIAQLDWSPAATKGQRLATSLTITGVDMAAFGQAMGWPAFPGRLAGAVPSLRWVNDRLELDGGLTANVFDGFVDITRLSLQQPFGTSPVLNADIFLKQLDLGAVTSVFDFGSITGRLDGSIDDLRLVNWNPVAFNARLLAGGGGRISQRAVNNLTSVGGGGIAAGLQGVVLKWFKTFGYKQIGLNCTLRGSVCKMSGLEPTAGGYTIVEGRGLPRLHVIGHQSEVDWPTLVKRLEDAIHGAAPQIH